MSKLVFTVAVTVLVVAGPALAQEPPRTPAPPSAVAMKRAMYAVRYGSAGELADVLSQQYQNEPAFRAVAAASSNTVLLSAPPDLVAEAIQTLGQLDRQPRSLTVEVYFAEVVATPGQPADVASLDPKTLSGPADDIVARLDGLRQQGRLTGLRRIRVSATEGQRSTVNAAEEVSVVMSTQQQPFAGLGGRGGPGGVMANISRRNIGTLVEVLPRVAPDGLVQLELKVDDSRAPAESGQAEGGPAPGVLTNATMKGTLTVRTSQAVVATGSAEGGPTKRQSAVVVVVRLAEPDGRGK